MADQPEQNVKEENTKTNPIAVKEEEKTFAPNILRSIIQNIMMLNEQNAEVESLTCSQQQSQSCVFSTQLANGTPPRTNLFLEKKPLQTEQFSGQNPAKRLKNMTQMNQNRVRVKNVAKAGPILYGGEPVGPNDSQNPTWQNPAVNPMSGNLLNHPGHWPGQLQSYSAYNPIHSPMENPLNIGANSIGNSSIGSPNMTGPICGNGPQWPYPMMGAGQNQYPGMGSGWPKCQMIQQQSGGPSSSPVNPTSEMPQVLQPTLTGVDQGSPSGDCLRMGPGPGEIIHIPQGMIQGQGGPMWQHISNTMMLLNSGPGPSGLLQSNMVPNPPSMTMMPESGPSTDSSHGSCSTKPTGLSQHHPELTMLLSQPSKHMTSEYIARLEELERLILVPIPRVANKS